MINGMKMNDYDKANIEKIEADLKKYRVTYTQKEAGFTSEIEEEVINITMPARLHRLYGIIEHDNYYRFRNGDEIVADTPVKVLGKLHQISSGTIITEAGKYKILDNYKALYIRDHYQNKKIAIFYKFISEGEMLREEFGSTITESPEEFNGSTDKIFISQVQSGSMGINLSTADILIFFNIDFSATQ
jgi:SNF2 family DNA or RNA helicase